LIHTVIDLPGLVDRSTPALSCGEPDLTQDD
jgi:hypothetical protein